ncbi:MAG: ABC transporter ATP-binding protein [Bacillota bacterium]
METVVEVRGLAKRFGRVWALREVNLAIPRGAICGLLGVNGAGKSTLLRILAGVQRPTCGEVRVAGLPPGRLSKARVAFAPEIDHFYRWMDVGDALEFSASFFGDFDRVRAIELLQLMQLRPASPIDGLSRGLRARLKLVLVLARDADLILLDEPFSGIDPISRDRIMEGLLHGYRASRTTVLLATHLVGEAEALFDRVVFLHNGRVVLDEEAEALRAGSGRSIDEIFREVLA